MPDDPRSNYPRRDDLDTLLDAALASYVHAAPSPGLTPRILMATRSIDHHSAIRWTLWAIPAIAALLAVMILLPVRHIHRDPPPSALQLSRSASPAPVTAPRPIEPGPARKALRPRATATISAATPA